MEQIDLFKIQDELTTKSINRVYKSKEAIEALARTLSKLTAFLVFPSEYTLSLVATTILEIIPLGKISAESGLNTHLEICDILRNTTTYRELTNEYNEFIKDLANFVRERNFTSSKEICCYLEEIISLSHLSVCNHNEYHKDRFSQEYSLPEIYGAKVLSGYHICRHYSSIIVDVLTELNYEACNVAVRPVSDNPETILKLNLQTNHSVVGVYENGTKYYFDPTASAFGIYNDELPANYKDDYRIAKMLSLRNEGYYVVPKPTFTINFNKEDLQKKIHKAPIIRMSIEEFERIKTRSFIQAFDNDYEALLQFKKRNLERMKRICSLYQELMPSQDEPIKKWLVRK